MRTESKWALASIVCIWASVGLLRAFAPDLVNIADVQPHQLGAAQAGCVKEFEDGSVAQDEGRVTGDLDEPTDVWLLQSGRDPPFDPRREQGPGGVVVDHSLPTEEAEERAKGGQLA